MRRKGFMAVLALVAGSVMFCSCVGSFSLFNKLAGWNKDATKYKLLNELIFLLISPAYVVCGAADLFVLNTIEFWSGDNPLASNVGKTVKVKGDDGLMYAVKYMEDGYEVTRPSGEVFHFRYDKAADTWSMEQNGVSRELFRFNHDGTIRAVLPTGEKTDVALSEAGLFQLRSAMAGATYFMAAR